jgi:hypothetical protein
MTDDDPYADLKRHALTPEQLLALGRPVNVSRKIKKRREQFVMVPWAWLERLNGATGQTYRVALCLLHASWKNRGEPFKLANGMLRMDGVSRQSKWRALSDLERRRLIVVERRPNRSPIVRVLVSHP